LTDQSPASIGPEKQQLFILSGPILELASDPMVKKANLD